MRIPPVYTGICLLLFFAFAVAAYRGASVFAPFATAKPAVKTANQYHK